VPVVGYRTGQPGDGTHPGLEVVSWGTVFSMTWRYLAAYANAQVGGQGFAILSPDWIKADGLAVPGFNVAALQADLALLQ
jgi:hypothetical protein